MSEYGGLIHGGGAFLVWSNFYEDTAATIGFPAAAPASESRILQVHRLSAGGMRTGLLRLTRSVSKSGQGSQNCLRCVVD